MESKAKEQPIELRSEWLDTSSNDILDKLVEMSATDQNIAQDIETLVFNKTISKRIATQLTYDDMYENSDSLWMVMLHSGYLTCDGIMEDGNICLRIPNEEIHRMFDQKIIEIATRDVGRYISLHPFCDAVASFDATMIERELNYILERTIGIRDTASRTVKENYCHEIMNTALHYRDDWRKWSNPERGERYCEIMVEDEDEEWVVLFELKHSDSSKCFTIALTEAKIQIYKCDYAEVLFDYEYPKTHKYVVAFRGRRCKVEEVPLPVT